MTKPNIYVTIQGHFYQPPRENPWLGTIERQSSAYPYHDWNEKIAAACYTPNTVSRILDEAPGVAAHTVRATAFSLASSSKRTCGVAVSAAAW